MSQNRIYLCLAHMSGEEQKFIKEAFDTNWVVPLGPNVNGFEADLEAFMGEGKKVVALSAGTAAVHLALIACGVKAGDEVLCQSFTFCASANHINNIVKPVSKAGHATKVIFLTADAFGVLPPVSKLTPEQTKYYFLSGFTAKLAGTERGITEPTPTFSACFGAAFLSLHPTKYGEELVKRMEKVGATAYLVNTGWNGTGKRISIKDTRAIIDRILDGSMDKAETITIPMFNLAVPTQLEGVDTNILDPRNTYATPAEWAVKAEDLAGRFVKNFKKFEGNEAGKALVAAGPQL